MPQKTETKSFRYHGIDFQKKNMHKLIHLIYSSTCYHALEVCICASTQTIHQKQYNKK